MSRQFDSETRKELRVLKEHIVGECTICNGTGYLLTDGQDDTCKCMKVFSYVKELWVADIPSPYWFLAYNELHLDEAYKKLLHQYFTHFESARKQNLGLFFMGTNGVGKTAMMCEVGKFAISQGCTVKYFTVQRYLNAIMTARPMELDYDVLLIDELDKAYMKEGSSFVPKTVEDLLRSTIAWKVVIVATNETEEGIKELFGESTISMLKRKLKFVPVAGSDYSDTLQSSWTKQLQTKVDYYHPHIVEMAEKTWTTKHAG